MSVIAVALYWPVRQEGFGFLQTGLFMFALAAGGLGIVLRMAPQERRSLTGTLLLAAAVISAAAAWRVAPAARARAWFGVPKEHVAWCAGRAAGDLQPLEDGGGRVPLELRRCGSREAVRTDAGGSITVFLDESLLAGEGTIYRGEKVKIPLKLWEGSGEAATAAGAVQRLGWSSRESELRAGLHRFLRGRLRSFGGGLSDFITALLLGVKRAGVFPAAEEFRRAGTAHLLALSGMHLGALYLFVLVTAAPLLGRRRAVCAAAMTVCGYLWLIGPRPSLVRAALMCILGTAVYLRRGRRPDALSLLGVAFLLQVLIDPASAGSLSFMLSYSALAGILIAAAPVAGLLPFWIPPAVRLPLAVGVAAQLATAPLLAAVFGRIYPAGVCATLILSPLVMLLLYTGLVFVLWGAVGGAAAPAVFWQIEGILKEFARLLYRCARVIAGAAAEVPPLMTGAKGVTAAAVISAAVLTGLLAGSYAVSSRRSRKRRDETAAGLRFAEVDQPLSGRTQYRSPAPLWAELPDQPGSPGEDHRAA